MQQIARAAQGSSSGEAAARLPRPDDEDSSSSGRHWPPSQRDGEEALLLRSLAFGPLSGSIIKEEGGGGVGGGGGGGGERLMLGTYSSFSSLPDRRQVCMILFPPVPPRQRDKTAGASVSIGISSTATPLVLPSSLVRTRPQAES